MKQYALVFLLAIWVPSFPAQSAPNQRESAPTTRASLIMSSPWDDRGALAVLLVEEKSESQGVARNLEKYDVTIPEPLVDKLELGNCLPSITFDNQQLGSGQGSATIIGDYLTVDKDRISITSDNAGVYKGYVPLKWFEGGNPVLLGPEDEQKPIPKGPLSAKVSGSLRTNTLVVDLVGASQQFRFTWVAHQGWKRLTLVKGASQPVEESITSSGGIRTVLGFQRELPHGGILLDLMVESAQSTAAKNHTIVQYLLVARPGGDGLYQVGHLTKGGLPPLDIQSANTIARDIDLTANGAIGNGSTSVALRYRDNTLHLTWENDTKTWIGTPD